MLSDLGKTGLGRAKREKTLENIENFASNSLTARVFPSLLPTRPATFAWSQVILTPRRHDKTGG